MLNKQKQRLCKISQLCICFHSIDSIPHHVNLFTILGDFTTISLWMKIDEAITFSFTLNLCIIMIIYGVMRIMIWWIMGRWRINKRLGSWNWYHSRSFFVNVSVGTLIIQVIYASYTWYLKKNKEKFIIEKILFWLNRWFLGTWLMNLLPIFETIKLVAQLPNKTKRRTWNLSP